MDLPQQAIEQPAQAAAPSEDPRSRMREDGTLGPRTPSDLERGQTVTPGSGEEGLLDIACAEDVWERDVITSLDEAVRVGREALEE